MSTVFCDLLTRCFGLGGLAVGEAGFWLPTQSSTVARDVDWNWGLVYWISVFFFALVTFLMAFFVLRYRGGPDQAAEESTSHNMPLEVFWSVVPTLLVIVMFWNGYVTFLDMATPPANAYEVQVTGQKWNWLFQYPNGHVDGTLHVPEQTDVSLVMTSLDVIHSFYVPEFRVKRDVIPGRYAKLWFNALRPGTYDVFCAEYCGTSHSGMLTRVVVHPRGEFEAWLAEASDFLSRMPPAEAGALLYNQRGCKQCHSVDGTAGTGPTFLGTYGARHALASGETIEVDENYVRESILVPQAKLVAGFEPVMPTFQGRLKDEEIGAIIEYLKTLER